MICTFTEGKKYGAQGNHKEIWSLWPYFRYVNKIITGSNRNVFGRIDK